MNFIDSFYTPSNLADDLIKYINKNNINNIVDFCIGNGDLINSARKKWKNSKYYGIDISETAINNLKKQNSKWELSQCDFLNEEERCNCKILRKNEEGFDLILLNPPFSCLGSTIHKVEIDNIIFYTSTSMKFLVESIKYLKDDGGLYAIMPMSVAYSQKDSKLWDYLTNHYLLKIIDIPNGNYFKGCSPNIIFISINDKKTKKIIPKFNQIPIKINFNVSIIRGRISMHKINHIKTNGLKVIHTTNLIKNKIQNLTLNSNYKSSILKGPAVIFPRVGKPNKEKIAIVKSNQEFIISDCIIAIKTKNNSDARNLMKILISYWFDFEKLYKGTGAKYITIERMKYFLKINK